MGALDGKVALITGAGRGFGLESPVHVFADTFNVAVDLVPDAELAIEAEAVERALYVLEGDAQLDGADIPEKHLLLLDRGARPVPPETIRLAALPLDILEAPGTRSAAIDWSLIEARAAWEHLRARQLEARAILAAAIATP